MVCCRSQVSTELHDEPLADLLSVPLKVHFCSQPHVVVAVHKVPQTSCPCVGRRTVSDAPCMMKLFSLRRSSRTANSKACPASRVPYQHTTRHGHGKATEKLDNIQKRFCTCGCQATSSLVNCSRSECPLNNKSAVVFRFGCVTCVVHRATVYRTVLVPCVVFHQFVVSHPTHPSLQKSLTTSKALGSLHSFKLPSASSSFPQVSQRA